MPPQTILWQHPPDLTDNQIHKKLAHDLPRYMSEPMHSTMLIVEGSLEKPVIGLRYPGKKVRQRKFKNAPRSNSALWANLLDFAVTPFIEGVEQNPNEFTFLKLLQDFYEHKRDDDDFWEIVLTMYTHNRVTKPVPELGGIDPEVFLLTVKWIWIQEDLNYRYKSAEIGCATKYTLENDKGSAVSGVGRRKFFAALMLLRGPFTVDEVKKIIPLFG